MSADQSCPVSRVSVVGAVTQIRALCVPLSEAPERPIPGRDEWEHGFAAGQTALAQTIRAVLDAVSVDATPAQGIDRSALAKLLDAFIPDEAFDYERLDALTTAVLALVRPVEGVVLSPEEAALRAQEARSAAVEDGTY